MNTNMLIQKRSVETAERAVDRGNGSDDWPERYPRIVVNVTADEPDIIYIRTPSHTWAERGERFTSAPVAAERLAQLWLEAEDAWAASPAAANVVNVENLSERAARLARCLRKENDYRYAIVAQRSGRGWRVYPKLCCFGLALEASEKEIRF